MATYSKSAKTREHIFQTALRLFFERGYDNTSLKDIAEAAQVSTGTLYRYFPTKSDLLFQIRENSQKHLREVAESLPSEMSLADKLLLIIAEDQNSVARDVNPDAKPSANGARLQLALAIRRESYRSSVQLKQEEGFRESLRAIYRTIIEGAQVAGTYSSDIDAATLAEVVSALYFQTLDQAVLQGELNMAEAIRPKLQLVLDATS